MAPAVAAPGAAAHVRPLLLFAAFVAAAATETAWHGLDGLPEAFPLRVDSWSAADNATAATLALSGTLGAGCVQGAAAPEPSGRGCPRGTCPAPADAPRAASC